MKLLHTQAGGVSSSTNSVADGSGVNDPAAQRDAGDATPHQDTAGNSEANGGRAEEATQQRQSTPSSFADLCTEEVEWTITWRV